MRLLRLTFLLSFAILFSLSSCKQAQFKSSDLALKAIPADASTVTAFRIPQIMVKADFDQFKTLPVYQKMIDEAKKENLALGKIVENPAQSGIDLSQNIYAFTQFSKTNPQDIFNGILLPIKDHTAFSKMIEEMDLEKSEKATEYGAVKTGRNSGLMWSEDLALIAMTTNRRMKDWETMNMILSGKGSTIADDPNLQKSISQDYDVVTWVSSNAIANFKDAQLMIAGLGFDPDVLKDNFIQGYLNFEKGEVVGHSDLLLQKSLTTDLDLLFKEEVKTDFSPYTPGENLGLAFSAALDLKGFNQVLSERPQSKGFLNYALKEYGLSIDDISKAFGGDLLLAVYGEGDQDRGYGLFSTNIDDKDIFNQFLTVAMDYELLEKDTENFYRLKSGQFKINQMLPSGSPQMSKDQPYLLLAHDMVFISTNTTLLSKIKDGGIAKANQLPNEFKSNMGSNIFSAIVDFTQLDNTNDNKVELPIKDFKIQAGRKSSEFHLNLEDQNTNSLKTLLWELNKAYEKEELKFESNSTI